MLANYLSVINYTFTVLTEAKLRDQNDAEVNIDDYTIFCQDRNRQKTRNRGRESCGVALNICNDLAGSAEVVLNFSSGVKLKNLNHSPTLEPPYKLDHQTQRN